MWKDPWKILGHPFHEALQFGLLQPSKQSDTITLIISKFE